MNALKRRILALIDAQGPLTVAQYMAMALGDPGHGYYMRRDPLGRDFITAPEVSQIFGELIGLCLVQMWEDRGRPSPFNLVELGPGRGTLLADMLGAAAKVQPEFVRAARVVLVETSPALRDVQAKTLFRFGVTWVAGIQGIRVDGPLFAVANEFFDALPIRQFAKAARGWHERVIVRRGDELQFGLAPDVAAEALLPQAVHSAPEGSIIEINAPAVSIVRDIARRIADVGGVALIVDYGHGKTAVGDTLQAMKAGAYVDPLAEPGEADLTAHVDFEALATAAKHEGVRVIGPVAQGDFLERLGIGVRAERLMHANPETAAEIRADVDRLTSPFQMGTLFKAMALIRAGEPSPPGFPSS